MKKLINQLAVLSLAVIVFACADEKITKILPANNVNSFDTLPEKLNTALDEVAPISRPKYVDKFESPYFREFQAEEVNYRNILASSNLTKNDFGLRFADNAAYNNLTKNVESISFVNRDSGFVAFSHPPTQEYAQATKLPLKGIVGGTDIFEFSLQGGDLVRIKNLEGLDEINSPYWDSQPFAADTMIKGKRITLLLWSSDRDNPYSKAIPIKGETVKRGTTDLFYSFRVDGKWLPAKKLEQGISTNDFNEGTPFLYCLCNESTLIFSSDRNATKEADYDLFYVKVKVDFKNLLISHDGEVRTFDKSDEAKSLKKDEEDTPGSINSSADERFPFIPFPYSNNNSKYLYFSSNRFEKAKPYRGKKDSVYVNAGGYDIYRFELPKTKEFECVPPPPPPPPPVPKLYVKVKVNEYELNGKGDTVKFDKDVRAEYEFLALKPKKQEDSIATKSGSDEPAVAFKATNLTNIVYQINLNTDYLIRRTMSGLNCATGRCTPVSFTSPKYIEENDTLTVELDCRIEKRDPVYIDTSFSKGIAMFVTGYWWPLTTENFESFKDKDKANKLSNAQFIDQNDYKYYDEVVKRNDAWFESYFENLESLLKRLDNCYNNQKIVISVHGFTDPCRLRATANDEFTRFSGEGDITYNDVVVKDGTNMKKPELTTTAGENYKLPIPSQDGNAMLAMLRSYFTKVTIDNGIRARLANNRALLDRYYNNVEFKLNYFGVYDPKQCPGTMNNILTMDLPNSPSNPEACNLPYSRRVMIYTDIVTNQSLEKGFERGECGQMIGRKIEKQIVVELKNKEQDKQVTKREVKTKQKENKPAIPPQITSTFGGSELGCPGPCFWIEFGEFANEEEFNFIKSFLESQGFQDLRLDPRFAMEDNKKYILISGTKDNRPEIEKELADFESQLKTRFSKIMDISKLKCKIMPERKKEDESMNR